MLNTYIELIFSIVAVFALFSILVSLLNELYRQLTRDRGKMLYTFVRKMLYDGLNPDLAYLVFRHPMIDNMRRDETTQPSFIDPKVFATALIQTVGELAIDVKYTYNQDGTYAKSETRPTDPVSRFRLGVETMQQTPVKSTLLGLVERAEKDKDDTYTVLEVQIMEWFSNQMNALGQVYKHKQRKSLTVCAAVVTLALNIDGLHLVHELRRDPGVRAGLVAKAEVLADQYPASAQRVEEELPLQPDTLPVKKYLQEVRTEVDEAELPIGWGRNAAPLSWFYGRDKQAEKEQLVYDSRRNQASFRSVVTYLLGLFISIFSLSFGAPFWYDILNKLTGLKKAGK